MTFSMILIVVGGMLIAGVIGVAILAFVKH